MTDVLTRAQSETVPITNTVFYTCPDAAESAIIIGATANNPTVAAANLTLNVVNSGYSAAAFTEYITDQAFAAGANAQLTPVIGLVLLNAAAE